MVEIDLYDMVYSVLNVQYLVVAVLVVYYRYLLRRAFCLDGVYGDNGVVNPQVKRSISDICDDIDSREWTVDNSRHGVDGV